MDSASVSAPGQAALRNLPNLVVLHIINQLDPINAALRGAQCRTTKENLTPQISALLLPEPSTRLLNPRREGNLYILRHRLLPTTHTTLRLGVLDHNLNPLNSLLTIMEAPSDLLRQSLNYTLILSAKILVPKPRKQVLVVQFIQLG